MGRFISFNKTTKKAGLGAAIVAGALIWQMAPAAHMANAKGASSGAADYQRCAACHTKTGAGVPGAFPPLKSNVTKLARSNSGRAYLVSAVNSGLAGPITVNGKRYSGVMPAQSGLSSARLAKLLNYIVTDIAKGKARPFTAQEVAKLKARKTSPSQTAKARPAV